MSSVFYKSLIFNKKADRRVLRSAFVLSVDYSFSFVTAGADESPQTSLRPAARPASP